MDFHCHTYGSGDAATTVEEFAEAVERAGLDVVCVTDHNAVHVAQALQHDLDVRVVVGEEVRTHDGEIIGLFLDGLVSFGLPAADAAAAIRAQGGVVYVPHPGDTGRRAMTAPVMETLLSAGLLDAVEVFNARVDDDAGNVAAAGFAASHGLPGGAGSDAHYPEEIGSAWLELPDFDGPDALLEAMSRGRVVGRRYGGVHRSGWRPRIIPPQSTG